MTKLANSSESIWGRWDDMVNKESLKLCHRTHAIQSTLIFTCSYLA
jgi:hypothetical protein